jgi:hypothetical protein
MAERNPLTKEEFDAAADVYLVDGKKIDPKPEWEEGKYYGTPAPDPAPVPDADPAAVEGTDAAAVEGAPAPAPAVVGGDAPATAPAVVGTSGGPDTANAIIEVIKVLLKLEGKTPENIKAELKTQFPTFDDATLDALIKKATEGPEAKSNIGGRRRTKRKGRKGSRKSRKGAKKGAKKSKKSSQSQNGGRRRSSKNRRKHSRRLKH